MKKKSGCFRILLAFVCAFVALLLFRACTLKSYAESEAESITLSPQQTVALFGSHLDAIYYDALNDTSYSIDFEYAFPLQSVGYMANGGGFMLNDTWPQIYTTDGVRVEMANTTGIVYVADSSQWGGVAPVPSANSVASVNLHVPVSVPLIGIDRFKFNVFYSLADGYKGNGGSTLLERGCVQTEGKITLLTSFGNITKNLTNGIGTSTNGFKRPCTAGLPTYPYSGTGEIDETQYGTFTGFLNDITYTTSFDCTGFTMDCPWVGGADASSNDIWIIIGCPTLVNYDPPPIVTTAPPWEPVPGQTGLTGIGTNETGVNLTDVSIDLREIILNQRWQIYQNDINNENLIRANYNLSVIIELLNRIYTQMLANGELNLSLAYADQLDRLDSGIEARIQTALRGTWPTMPANAFGDAPALVGEFWSLCTSDGFEIFMYLGCFCLACSVAAWVLFKGRG